MLLYIIYTRGSVRYLGFFVHSLLDHSGYRYCLVSNGCTIEESALLKQICDQHPHRLSYLELSATEMMLHGSALNRLLALCDEHYFAFIDSDIFATAALPDVMQAISRYNAKAVFAALPVWVKTGENIMHPGYSEMIGTFNETADGRCLGNTYLAIYDRLLLCDVMKQYHVDFSGYLWEQLPLPARERLEQLQLKMKLYDTGKVINALLSDDQGIARNISIPGLCHIGGASFGILNEGLAKTGRQRLKVFMDFWPVNYLLRGRAQKEFEKNFLSRYISADEYHLNFNQRFLHRDVVRKYFLQLFLSLSRNRALPAMPVIADKEISRRVEVAAKDYIAMFGKYYRKNTITA
jgi:hypothetical protein